MENIIDKTDQFLDKLSMPLPVSLSQYVSDEIIDNILDDWGAALERLEREALRIEANSDDCDAMDEIKRTLHTLKGDAGICGLSHVSDVFHEAESLLECFIEEGSCPTDMLLKVKDWLQKIVDTIANIADQSKHQVSSEDTPVISEDTPVLSEDEVERPVFKTLIAEDDFTSRMVLQAFLKDFGASHVAINGKEAVEAVRLALEANEPYDMIYLDIMMPEMDGQTALKEIRACEEARGIKSSQGAKIIMTTALNDLKNVMTAFGGLCDAYLTKPIRKAKLLEEIGKLGLTL